MRHGTSGPHLRTHPDGLHDFLLSCSPGKSAFGVRADAIGALGYMSDCNRDEVLRLGRQGSVGKDLPAKGAPGVSGFFAISRVAAGYRASSMISTPRIKRFCQLRIE